MLSDREQAVAVVIPTYKRNDLLALCLNALAPGVQTLPAERYRVVVTDDGPPGENAEAMIAEQFPWAHWTQGPRRGPAANRNHGASQVTTDWIVFTDDDCIPDPEWLQAYASAITARPEAEVLEGKTVCREGLNSPLLEAPVNETGGYLWSCNMAIKRFVFEEMRGFDESFPAPASEDVDFRRRLQAHGYTFPFLADAVVNHPPRSVPPISKQALLDESIFYLQTKWEGPPSLMQDLRLSVRSWAKRILFRPKSWDSIKAIGYASRCLGNKVIRRRGWKLKYPQGERR